MSPEDLAMTGPSPPAPPGVPSASPSPPPPPGVVADRAEAPSPPPPVPAASPPPPPAGVVADRAEAPSPPPEDAEPAGALLAQVPADKDSVTRVATMLAPDAAVASAGTDSDGTRAAMGPAPVAPVPQPPALGGFGAPAAAPAPAAGFGFGAPAAPAPATTGFAAVAASADTDSDATRAPTGAVVNAGILAVSDSLGGLGVAAAAAAAPVAANLLAAAGGSDATRAVIPPVGPDAVHIQHSAPPLARLQLGDSVRLFALPATVEGFRDAVTRRLDLGVSGFHIVWKHGGDNVIVDDEATYRLWKSDAAGGGPRATVVVLSAKPMAACWSGATTRVFKAFSSIASWRWPAHDAKSYRTTTLSPNTQDIELARCFEIEYFLGCVPTGLNLNACCYVKAIDNKKCREGSHMIVAVGGEIVRGSSPEAIAELIRNHAVNGKTKLVLYEGPSSHLNLPHGPSNEGLLALFGEGRNASTLDVSAPAEDDGGHFV